MCGGACCGVAAHGPGTARGHRPQRVAIVRACGGGGWATAGMPAPRAGAWPCASPRRVRAGDVLCHIQVHKAEQGHTAADLCAVRRCRGGRHRRCGAAEHERERREPRAPLRLLRRRGARGAAAVHGHVGARRSAAAAACGGGANGGAAAGAAARGSAASGGVMCMAGADRSCRPACAAARCARVLWVAAAATYVGSHAGWLAALSPCRRLAWRRWSAARRLRRQQRATGTPLQRRSATSPAGEMQLQPGELRHTHRVPLPQPRNQHGGPGGTGTGTAAPGARVAPRQKLYKAAAKLQ